ncbi:hypothetical protein CFIMG_003097RAa [Ceratocystis fimbriata CBS 114723]|uniref:Uncharacterized protein n=1 Tax=Ceratocystis fimbriata CBS 114723 TaxID=1035309 RepID=A0A2C5X001_9PEZI|nr:hypothetical protein CFIMG_003097RAa [Ceratocystis fimbriata CBS 114723]
MCKCLAEKFKAESLDLVESITSLLVLVSGILKVAFGRLQTTFNTFQAFNSTHVGIELFKFRSQGCNLLFQPFLDTGIIELGIALSLNHAFQSTDFLLKCIDLSAAFLELLASLGHFFCLFIKLRAVLLKSFLKCIKLLFGHSKRLLNLCLFAIISLKVFLALLELGFKVGDTSLCGITPAVFPVKVSVESLLLGAKLAALLGNLLLHATLLSIIVSDITVTKTFAKLGKNAILNHGYFFLQFSNLSTNSRESGTFISEFRFQIHQLSLFIIGEFCHVSNVPL